MTVTHVDWTQWMASWDHQQEGYMANREERFSVLLDVVEAVAGREPRVLDLCCGPGSSTQRVLARFPGASVVAVDADPTLQLLGRRTIGEERVQWVLHDLTDPGWETAVAGPEPFDAVVSTTALHWLSAATLAAVYEAVGRLLRPGGVLVDGDHLVEPPAHQRLRELGRALRLTPPDRRPDYDEWWAQFEAAAADDPELAAAFARRAELGAGHHDRGTTPDVTFHEAALRHAGFTEVGTVWQRGDDRLLVGLRP